MDIGSFLLMLGLAYGLGVLWYDLLPGELPDRVWRVAAYPFVGIWLAQTLITPHFPGDPAFGGIHVVAALVGSIVAVIVDWVVTSARQPSLVLSPEPRRGVRPGYRRLTGPPLARRGRVARRTPSSSWMVAG